MSAKEKEKEKTGTINFSVFRNAKDSEPEGRQADSFDKLANGIRDQLEFRGEFKEDATREEIAALKDGELFSPAVYGQGATRSNQNVKQISFLCLDFDKLSLEDFERVGKTLTGIRHFKYATYSNRWARLKDLHQIRIVVELTEPVDMKKWTHFWSVAVDRFDAKADKACADPSRMYYSPSHPIGTSKDDAWFEDVPGKPLDVEELLSLPRPEWAEPDHTGRNFVSLPSDVTDAFLKALEQSELISGAYGDKFAIKCPWSAQVDEHDEGFVPHDFTTDTATVIWGSGLRAGYFRCLHQTCTAPNKRTRYDVLAWLRKYKPEAANLLHEHDMRVQIKCVEDRAKEVVDEAISALGRSKFIFQRGNILVRILSGGPPIKELVREHTAPTITKFPMPALREMLSRHASFIKHTLTKTGNLNTNKILPPEWVIEMVDGRKNWPGIRPVEAVTEFPVLRPSGTVINQPGYDAATGVMYLKNGTETPPIPDDPTDAQLKASVALIEEVISDFQFERPAHKSGFFAAMLSPLARHAYAGNCPLFLFDSSTPAAGKGLLAKVAGLIATGHTPGSSHFTPNDEEMDKRFVSWAIAGEPLVCFDNVGSDIKLGGDSLCRALTEPLYEGRLLGANETWKGVQCVTFYATGNNVKLGKDMDRRVCHIRIDPGCERPEERSGFKHPNLLDHVRKNKGKLSAAALTILVAYQSHLRRGGKPAKFEAWGSYETWSEFVLGAVVHAGLPDPSQARAELRKSADRDSSHRVGLVRGLSKLIDKNGGKHLTAREITNAVFGMMGMPSQGLDGNLQEAIRFLLDLKGRDTPTPKQIGELLAQVRGRTINGHTVMDMGENRDGVRQWGVVVSESSVVVAEKVQ